MAKPPSQAMKPMAPEHPALSLEVFGQLALPYRDLDRIRWWWNRIRWSRRVAALLERPVVGKSPVLVGAERNQSETALGVVVDAPSVALAQWRGPQARLLFGEERCSRLLPRIGRDALADRVHLEKHLAGGELVGMRGDQLVLERGDCRTLRPGRRLFRRRDRAVVGNLDERVRVVRTAHITTLSDHEPLD